MSQPYIGEIRLFAGNFAPVGWMFCQGQVLPISEYATLYNLIGTTYGGDGQQSFQLPDLQGRVPVHVGSGTTQGLAGGVEAVTLTTSQIPAHAHVPVATTAAASLAAPGNGEMLAAPAAGTNLYATRTVTSAPVALSPNAVANTGGSQPHNNLQPYLSVNFIISLFGIFPSQS